MLVERSLWLIRLRALGTRPSPGFMASLGNRQSTATGQHSPNVSQSAPAVGISSKNTPSTTTGPFGTNQARTSSTAPPKSLFNAPPSAGYGNTPLTTGGLFGSSRASTPLTTTETPSSTNPQSTSVNSSLPVTAEGQLPSRSQPPSGTSTVNTTSAIPARSTVPPWRASKAIVHPPPPTLGGPANADTDSGSSREA